MKKVIKIKESKVLEIIDNIISEQGVATGGQPVSVSASSQLGTYPQFDGLKTLAKDLKANVEKALRGATPYRIKNDDPNGVAIARIQGSALKLIMTLIPCKEEERDWYFDLSLAIYSQINTDGFKVLSAKLMEKATARGQAFVGAQDKIESLGRNHIQLDQLPNLDPNNPNKTFNLYIIYIAGGRPKGYQRAEVEPGEEQPTQQTNATKPATQEPTTQTTSEQKITKTVSGSFSSNDGDNAHNFKDLEDKLGPALKEVYDMGVNPKITNITAKITKSQGGQFTTSYNATISNSNDGKAWMGFTSRGSFGPNYESRADGQISGSTNLDGRPLEEKLKTNLGAGEMEIITTYKDSSVPVKQYFVQFTKPQQYPPHK